MKLRLLFLSVLTALIAVRASATVTITILAGQFTFANGTTPVPNGSLLLLVADTQQNGFGSLTAGNLNVGDFTNGTDDRILFRATVDTGLGSSSVSDTLSGAAFGSGWGAGDPLAIFWFSTLTGASTSVSSGAAYGFYTTGTPLDSSDPWVTPGDGSSISLNFLTSFVGGANANSLGAASLTAIPEPSTYAILLGSCGLGAGLLRRRRAPRC